jgi:hypothetical protein
VSTATTPVSEQPEGPGAQLVRPFGITVTVLYVLALSTFLLYALVKIWPHPTPGGTGEGVLT